MRRIALYVSVLILCQAALCLAQSNPLYIQFEPRPVKGALYRPVSA